MPDSLDTDNLTWPDYKTAPGKRKVARVAINESLRVGAIMSPDFARWWRARAIKKPPQGRLFRAGWRAA